jgi:hypothetical protein
VHTFTGLNSIGRVHRDGSTGQLPLDEALAAVEQGAVFFVRTPNVGAQEIAVSGRGARRYLRSLSDRTRRNNLSTLPNC